MRDRNYKTLQLALILTLVYAPRSAGAQVDAAAQLKIAISQQARQVLSLGEAEVLVELTAPTNLPGAWSANRPIKIHPESKKRLRKGRQTLRCAIVGAGEDQRFVVRVNIRTFQNVVVNKTDLLRHSSIETDDVSISRQETTHLIHAALDSVQSVRNKRTTRFVNAGEILTENMIELVPVVTKGKRVNVHFSKNALQIVLPGVAREDGRRGQRIRVRCLETRKTFRAKVIDATTVRVKLL